MVQTKLHIDSLKSPESWISHWKDTFRSINMTFVHIATSTSKRCHTRTHFPQWMLSELLSQVGMTSRIYLSINLWHVFPLLISTNITVIAPNKIDTDTKSGLWTPWTLKLQLNECMFSFRPYEWWGITGFILLPCSSWYLQTYIPVHRGVTSSQRLFI